MMKSKPSPLTVSKGSAPVKRSISDRGSMGRGQPQARDPNSIVTPPTQPLAELDITVVATRDEHGEHLIRELQRTRARVQHIWPMPEQMPIDQDVVFCEFRSDLPKRLPWLPGSPGSALILVLPAGKPLDLDVLHSCAPHAVVHLPVIPNAVLSALAVGRSHYLYEQRLRSRIEKLDDNLRTMRSVERAKAILIETKNLSEQDAYNFLRRTAMERRVSIGALAAMIVDSQELLG